MAAGRFAPLFAAATLIAPAAHGQTSPGTAAASERHAEWRARRVEHETQEGADVALLLRLRPDQRAGFQAWRASMRPPEPGVDRSEPPPAGALTTPQALDRMQARMAEHDARARAHLDATRRFYATLTPEQQPLFDALMRLAHDDHGWRGGPHMHGGPGGGPPMRDGMGPPPPPTA